MTDEALDTNIRALPFAPLEAERAGRALHTAQQALTRGTPSPQRRAIADRLTAAAAMGAITVYLTWAVGFLTALAH